MIARISLAALAIGLAATAAHAEDASEEKDAIVVTAQKANRTQVEQSGSVGVLGNKDGLDVPFEIKSYSAALILNQQPQTIGQVLENDPSVRTTYGFGNAAEQFVIRGFTLFGDDLGLDGLYGIAPRQLVAPELYDQVQVLNGASAFLNGAAPGGSGIGGSVNLITKRAGPTPLTRVTANYTSSGHVGGSFDLSRRFGTDDAFGLRINGAARAGDVATDGEYRSTYVIGAAFDWHNDRLRLTADLNYQRVHIRDLRPKVTIGTAGVPAVPKASHNYGQDWAYTTLRDVFGTARAEYDVTDNMMAYAQFGARDGSERGMYQGINLTNALTGAATTNGFFVPRTDNNEAATAGVRIKLAAGGITHEFNLGGSMIWAVNRNAYLFYYGAGFAQPATNIYSTAKIPLPASSGFVGGNLADPFPVGRTRLGSTFASDTIGAFDDRVLLTGGVRLQSIIVDSYSYTDGSLATRYNESAITPVLGLVVKPTDHISLFANRIEGLAQGPTAPIDANVLNSGQVFAPFTSTQYEVGGKVRFGKLEASLALFQITQPSAYSVPTPTAANKNAVTYAVDGKQRNRGVEFNVTGDVAKGLRVIAGGSVIDAKLRQTAGGVSDGKRAPGVPKYLLNGDVEWDVPYLPGFTLTGRVTYTGKQDVDVANTETIPSWTTVDLGARYVVVLHDKPVTFRAGVDNVANKRYWASAFDTVGAALLQGTPRTYKLSASIDL